MRRCDSSGAANIIVGFSFNRLAGCTAQGTFIHHLKSSERPNIRLRTPFQYTLKLEEKRCSVAGCFCSGFNQMIPPLDASSLAGCWDYFTRCDGS